MDKNVLRVAILILLHPEIPQDILKPRFSFNHNKSNLSSLAMRRTNFSSYVLNFVDRGIKKGQLCVFTIY